jgi:hypothetical protein
MHVVHKVYVYRKSGFKIALYTSQGVRLRVTLPMIGIADNRDGEEGIKVVRTKFQSKGKDPGFVYRCRRVVFDRFVVFSTWSESPRSSVVEYRYKISAHTSGADRPDVFLSFTKVASVACG